ncbi:tetratricopeptide repeat protein [Nitrospinae bacterium AH_259_B05_G02_I21]|nr:tetratricopeptide repeat protein [Nitrospinae bacterium AH_259_B05_G02_I21]
MRAAVLTIFALLLATFGFIVLNLEPATISLFGLVRVTHPLGVVLSVTFLAGALLVYLLMEGASLRRSWHDRQELRATKLSDETADAYHLGLEALAQGDLGAAREIFERVLRYDQDHVGASYALGNLERDAGDVEAAIRRHITANARKPGTPAILWALAEDYVQAGRVDECLRALDDLLAQAPNGREALAKKREVYEAAGRLEEAIEAAQALLRAGAPDDGSLNDLRLKAAQRAPTPESARMHLQAAIKHDKRCTAAYRLLGELFWKDDNAREAEKTWKSGWKAAGDLGLLHRLADAHLASNEGKKALKLVSQAREARSDDPLAALLHVQTALQLEAFDEAEKALAAETLADHPAAALLRLELASRQDRSDSIGPLSMEAAGALGTLQAPYACRACGKALDEWSAQCPACERYDTIQLAWIGKASLPKTGVDVAAGGEDQKSEEEPPS